MGSACSSAAGTGVPTAMPPAADAAKVRVDPTLPHLCWMVRHGTHDWGDAEGAAAEREMDALLDPTPQLDDAWDYSSVSIARSLLAVDSPSLMGSLQWTYTRGRIDGWRRRMLLRLVASGKLGAPAPAPADAAGAQYEALMVLTKAVERDDVDLIAAAAGGWPWLCGELAWRVCKDRQLVWEVRSSAMLAAMARATGMSVHALAALRDDQGTTPLHRVDMEAPAFTVPVLLAAGADPDALDCQGHTPLGIRLMYVRTWLTDAAPDSILMGVGPNLEAAALLLPVASVVGHADVANVAAAVDALGRRRRTAVYTNVWGATTLPEAVRLLLQLRARRAWCARRHALACIAAGG